MSHVGAEASLLFGAMFLAVAIALAQIITSLIEPPLRQRLNGLTRFRKVASQTL